MVKKTSGSAKRYGPRYGATLRRKVAVIEAVQRADQKCPHCNKVAARWQAVGIYICRKCDAKFTSGAYAIKQKVMFAEAAIDDTREEEDDEDEVEA